MSNRTELSRRSLLKVVTGVGAGFALGIFPSISCAEDPKKPAVVFEPSAWVKVEPDGGITVMIAKSDMGQGVRTALAMLVAEELDVDWKKVKVSQATSDPKFGRQGTGGSSSITSMNRSLREVGATARAMLLAAAGQQWGVDPATLTTANGVITNPATGKTIAYGELTAAASGLAIPGSPAKLKTPDQFRIIGKPTGRVDNLDVVTGRAKYGLDLKVDGMKYAVIARPPTMGGSLKTLDDAAARKVPGVVDVQKFGNGVAVIATNTWAAISGRDALKVTWNQGSTTSTKEIHEKLVGAVRDHLPMPDGSKVVNASYDFPFLAHATMEPMNAIADVKDDRADLYCGTQVPDAAQGTVAQVAGVPQGSVTVHNTLLGGGFGRRLQTDFIREAAGLSKQMKCPIKLVWTREDDMQNDFYRPMSHHSMRGALDATGKPVGWSHQALQVGGNPNARFGGAGIQYSIDGAQMLFGGIRDVPVPTGPWRSVEHTLLSVSNECFIDEMARASGKDPYEFRKDLIKSDRLKNVLTVAAENAGWGKPLPKGHARGIACFEGYGSYAAHVVEVSVADGKVKLHRVVAAIDCGMVINPKGVEAQIQGAITDGLSTALRAEITLENGGIVQSSWTNYKWMTLDAMPTVEVHIVKSDNSPGGMGEPGYPSVPAAVANAVCAATGKKVRKFPIKLEEMV
jgi:isoquinoline 1-oxidoreductase beta subunit